MNQLRVKVWKSAWKENIHQAWLDELTPYTIQIRDTFLDKELRRKLCNCLTAIVTAYLTKHNQGITDLSNCRTSKVRARGAPCPCREYLIILSQMCQTVDRIYILSETISNPKEQCSQQTEATKPSHQQYP